MSLVFNTPKSALNTTSKAIQNLKSGECPEPSLTTESVEYTENGEYSVATPEGFDGLSAVSVTVNIDTEAIADAAYAEGEAAQKAKLTSLNVTSNGTYNKEDGYNSVTVNVPSSEPNLETGVVEEAHLYGDYHPSEGYDGFATISVSVSPSAKGTAANPFTSMDDIAGEAETAGAIPMGSYCSVTITEDDTIEFLDIDQADDKTYVITKASTDSDYPDTSIMIVEGNVDSQDYGYHYKEWPTGFSLKAGDTLLLCGTDFGEGGYSMLYAYNGNLDETTWASSGSSCPDWSTIGWDCNDVTAAGIDSNLVYTAQKKAEYEAGTTNTMKNDRNIVFAPKTTIKTISTDTYDGVFYGCTALSFVPELTINVTSLSHMFEGCTGLVNIVVFDTSNVTDMSYMFRNCNSLKTIPRLNMGSVTNMSNMFANSAISTIPVLDTHNVTTMQDAFRTCSSLTSFPSLNTSNVADF